MHKAVKQTYMSFKHVIVDILNEISQNCLIIFIQFVPEVEHYSVHKIVEHRVQRELLQYFFIFISCVSFVCSQHARVSYIVISFLQQTSYVYLFTYIGYMHNLKYDFFVSVSRFVCCFFFAMYRQLMLKMEFFCKKDKQKGLK